MLNDFEATHGLFMLDTYVYIYPNILKMAGDRRLRRMRRLLPVFLTH
jgi:hypothetical protein